MAQDSPHKQIVVKKYLRKTNKLANVYKIFIRYRASLYERIYLLIFTPGRAIFGANELVLED